MKTKRTWTTRTMLAVFATALTAVGCNADQGSEKTAEVKDSIVKIGESREGCTIKTIYDLRSAKDIEVVAIDAGEWTGENLVLNLYNVNEEGEETRIDTRAVSMKHLLKQRSAAARRAEAANSASETSDYNASSQSGRSSTATESSNSSSQSSSTSDQTIMDLVENESNLYHLIDNASSRSRSAVTGADADSADQLDAEEESVDVSSDRDVSVREDDDFGDIGFGDRTDIDESESLDASSSSVSVDQQSSQSQSAVDQLDEDAADRQEEILQSSDRSLVNSAHSSSDTSATSTSSDSLVATEESEFSEVSESSATSSDMHSLEDMAESEESELEEMTEEMSDELSSFVSRAMVFNELQDIKSNHLRLEVVFEGSVDATQLDLFMGSQEKEAALESLELDELFSASFAERFDSCELETTGSVDVGGIGGDSIGDTVNDLGDLAREEDLDF